ncbi:MAG: integration host factor subunit beta [Planctomycetia bacterium]|nr:integration host factor subunit beta [Planctomycetia bacterium]
MTKKNNTKKDIVRSIAEQIDLPQLRTKELVQKTFDALIDTLVRDRRIELRNFGVFQIKERKARMARNPRTGAKVPVHAKHVVTFKPGKEMEERVRQLDALGDDGKASGEVAPPVGGTVAPPQPAAGVAGGGANSGGVINRQ